MDNDKLQQDIDEFSEWIENRIRQAEEMLDVHQRDRAAVRARLAQYKTPDEMEKLTHPQRKD